jgi:hypothetical protein
VEKAGNMCTLLTLHTTLIRSIQGKDSEFTMIGRQSMGREGMEIHLKWGESSGKLCVYKPDTT